MKIFAALLVSFLMAIEIKASDTTLIIKFSPQQLKHDLDFMVQVMNDAHPNLYHTISQKDFHFKYDSIKNSITDSMTRLEAWPKFATLIGAVNEGHTALNWPPELTNDKSLHFPVLIREFDGEAFVVRFDANDAAQLKPGDRIISINGESSVSIMKRMMPFVGGLPAWKKLIISNQLGFYLGMSGFGNSFLIRFLSGGQEQTIKLAALQRGYLTKKMIEYRKASGLASYSFKRLDDNTGYLNFRSMNNFPGFTTFIDSIFTAIEKEPVRGLIIDLRQNGGGNSILGDKLLEYITTKKYRMSAGSKWKISQPYKDYYNHLPAEEKFMKNKQQEKDFLEGKNGSFIEFKSSEKKPAKQANRFKGKTCFLIGPNTFSSANMLANAIKDYNLSTLIGEPTGESPNDYGEVISLQLPNTAIGFFTSTKKYIRANGNGDNPEPILPDHFVQDKAVTPQDEVLEYAIDFIKSKKK